MEEIRSQIGQMETGELIEIGHYIMDEIQLRMMQQAGEEVRKTREEAEI